jgi:hypothetical protein
LGHLVSSHSFSCNVALPDLFWVKWVKNGLKIFPEKTCYMALLFHISFSLIDLVVAENDLHNISDAVDD